MEQNKVSVIIPVYNRFTELQNALASVFNDETICFDIEVIVVNDGSTDGDYNLLASDKVFVFNQSNQGVSAARNKGISLSKGEYLFFLDADDEFVEGSLLERYKILVQKRKKFVCGGVRLVKGKTDKLQIAKWTSIPLFYQITFRNIVATSTVGVHRSIIDNYYLFPEHIKRSEDWIAWHKLIRINNSIYVSKAMTIKFEDGLGITHLQESIDVEFKRLKNLLVSVLNYNVSIVLKFRIILGIAIRFLALSFKMMK